MIAHHRKQLDSSTKRLKRARRLYVFLCRHAIRASADSSVIEHMSKRMMDSGMYAKPMRWQDPRRRNAQDRDFRYRIIRWLFNIERGSYGQTKPGEWTNWLSRNGYNWNFHKIRADERQVG